METLPFWKTLKNTQIINILWRHKSTRTLPINLKFAQVRTLISSLWYSYFQTNRIKWWNGCMQGRRSWSGWGSHGAPHFLRNTLSLLEKARLSPPTYYYLTYQQEPPQFLWASDATGCMTCLGIQCLLKIILESQTLSFWYLIQHNSSK